MKKDARIVLVKKLIDALNDEIGKGGVTPVDVLGILESLKFHFVDQKKAELGASSAEGMFQ